MTTQTPALQWRGATNEPEWVVVRTGMLGGRTSFAPLGGASMEGGVVRLPYERAQIEKAPGIDPETELGTEEETNLDRHYGIDYGAALPSDVSGREPVGHDASAPTTDEAMTRSEEEPSIGATRREAGRARLRTWVETETVTETGPVERERAVISREPITDANIDRAMDGPTVSSEEHDFVLAEEQVVAEKRAVSKRRIRLDTEIVTERQGISETLRKERIEVEGDVESGIRSVAPRPIRAPVRVAGALTTQRRRNGNRPELRRPRGRPGSGR